MNNKLIKAHSRKIIAKAEKLDLKLSVLNLDESPYRKATSWITIDWFWTRVRDDWIYLEKTKKGWSVYVSIIDTSEDIKKNSDLYLEAKKRISSFYLNTHSYQLIPDILSTNRLSLNDKATRKTQTTRIDLDNYFNPISSEIFESTFYNEKAYTYSNFNEEYENHDSDNYKYFRLLWHVALWLKYNREWKWFSYKEKITLNLDKLRNEENSNIGQIIISEFAILKKIEDAKIAYKEKINLLFKGHNPELQNKFIWNFNLWRSFFSHKPVYHSWLGTLFFTSTTSPTRLYSDLVNQIQQKCYLRKEEEIYSIKELRKISFEINSQFEEILNSQKEFNWEVFIKRIKRLLKKLEEDNYENIWSLPDNLFHSMIKYFTLFETKYFLNYKIYDEILFRLSNNYLSKKTIWLIKSIPKEDKNVKILKEILNNKEQ